VIDLSPLSPLAGQTVAGPVSVSPILGSRPNAALHAVRLDDAQLDPKLVSAAHQFEASLMQELLKPLNSGSIFGDEEDPESAANAGLGGLTSSEGSGSALLSFGSEALAKALSEKGGLGIARKVLDHFEATEAPPAKLVARPKRLLSQFTMDE